MKQLIVSLLLSGCTLLPAYGAQLETRKSADAGVTVAVTPQDLSSEATDWHFKVVLDAHSADLSDDLRKSSILVDSGGATHKPIAWDGAPPGGHHREGVLRFKAISPLPDWIELRINRPRESQFRSFHWGLK